jgi:hypothetical protein
MLYRGSCWNFWVGMCCGGLSQDSQVQECRSIQIERYWLASLDDIEVVASLHYVSIQIERYWHLSTHNPYIAQSYFFFPVLLCFTYTHKIVFASHLWGIVGEMASQRP